MMFPFTEALIVTNKFDAECAELADRHYSRRTVGDRQFLPPGRTIVLRNAEGTLVFAWHWPLEGRRADGEVGYSCSIFRNESGRLSSEVILEAEGFAFEKWGRGRVFTYVNPKKLGFRKCRGAEYCPWPPGRCFIEAGWRFTRVSKGGLHLLVKEP